MMDALTIAPTKSSPEVVLNPEANEFHITGRSFPENAVTFYRPVLDWLDRYKPTESQTLEFRFELMYISSSSLISVLDVIRKVNTLRTLGVDLVIKWCYEEDDEDIKRIGIDYSKVVDAPIELEEIKEED